MPRTISHTKETLLRIQEKLRRESALSIHDRLEFLKAHFGVSMKDLADIIGVDEKTLGNWKRLGVVGPRDSFRLDLVYEIVEAARGVLKPGKEHLWYNTPNPALGNYTPVNLLKDPQGLRDVKNVLERRKWGLPA
ncbi:MAG: DUF2384 domain-containing protein [Elusimicrobia bacterium]|nr:DUF2384 domain-containing protein [Elusimicrobiota bacterium]